MAKTFLILFFSFCLSLLFAQNKVATLSGKVFDAFSNEPLEFVQISIKENPSFGSVSNQKGYFEISSLDYGAYTIIISYLGYEKRAVKNVEVLKGKVQLGNLFIEKSTINLDEINITYKKSIDDTINFETPQTLSARSFSLEQTELIAGGLGDPSRIAFSFAGVRNQGDVQTGISIRGNSPNSLLWSIEGFEVQNPNHFSRGNLQGAINLINSNNLKTAKFYTAAFPARYNNGTSGVFDLYMRQGNTKKHNHSISLGVLGLEASTEGPLSKSKKHSYLVSYRYSTLTVLNKMGLNTVGVDLPTFQDVNYKLFFNTKKLGVFEIFGLWGSSEIVQLDKEKRPYTYKDNYQYLLTGIKNQKQINGKNRLVSGIVFSQSKSYFEQIEKFYKNDFKYPINDNVIQFDTKLFSKFSENHEMIIGANIQMPIFNFEANTFTSEDTVFRNANIKALKSQIHLQQNYMFKNNWLLKLGFNVQYFSFNKSTTIDPRLNLEKQYNKTHTLSFGIGLHSKLESLGFYGINIQRISFQENINRTRTEFNRFVSPSRSLHLVAGYKWQLAKDFSFLTEVYFQHLYNVPISNRQNNPFYSALNEMFLYYSRSLENDGLGRNYGIDFTLEKTYTNGYYLLFTGSLYQSKFKNPSFDAWFNTRFNGNFIFNAIAGKDFKLGKHKQNLFSLSFRSTWAGNNRIEYDFGFAEIFQKRLSNYFRLDTRIAYKRFKEKYRYTLSFDIQNTTNRINENPLPNIDGVGIIPFLTYRIEF